MEIIHFESNKITNLKPYLSIEFSNSKACGNIYIGVTDNQTTFYYRFFIERGIEKLNKKMKFFIYKTDKNNMFCSLEAKENLTLIFVVENEKIVFSENLPFSELCKYHKENKKVRVEKLFEEIEEKKERERLEREKLKAKEVEVEKNKNENSLKVKDLVNYSETKEKISIWFEKLTKEEKELLKLIEFGKEVAPELYESELLHDYTNNYTDNNFSQMLFADYGDGQEEHFIYLSSEDMKKAVECFYDVPNQDDFDEDDDQSLEYFINEISPYFQKSVELSIIQNLSK
jgi:hypothetical protein